MFCLHAVGTLGMFLVQWLSGSWIFSWANYWSAEKGWDYGAAMDMLLLAPLREELTFRGLMFAIFYLRGAAFKVAPEIVAQEQAEAEAKVAAADAAAAGTDTAAGDAQLAPVQSSPAQVESLAWTSSWRLDCVVASAVMFGLVHLLNLFGARYTRTYILLQVVLGMLIGSFYCMRMVTSSLTMLEPVLLHVINNAFSSFLPLEADLDLASPMVALPLTLTFVVYLSLIHI